MSDASQDELKARAAARALDFVKPGMRLGLGSGTTAKHFVAALADRVSAGLVVRCVPTSEATRAQAEAAGIPLTTLDETPELDLVVDGADEFDGQLRLIKGGGGALLREKIVAAASKTMVVIADRSKQVETLGHFPLPVEVNVFGLGATTRLIEHACAAEGLSGPLVLRRDTAGGAPFRTDGGHLLIDCHLGAIPNPERLAEALVRIPGVVEHGLFIGLASAVIMADGSGTHVIGHDPNK
jgi:ribose 5-phosphate isomerase A